MKGKREKILYLVDRFMAIANSRYQVKLIGFLEGIIFAIENKKE